MIHGIGTDLLSLERMEKVWERHGPAFAERILMPAEMERFDASRRPVRYLAMRFAAKEAIVKALGTGFARGLWLRDVGIAPNPMGRPEPIYSPRGAAVRDQLGAGEGYVTLTDEAGLVVAFAVLLRAGVTGNQHQPAVPGEGAGPPASRADGAPSP